MTETTAQRPQPQNQAAHRVREIYLAERGRRSEQFGRSPHQPTIDEWVRSAGKWRLSAIWFLPDSGGTLRNHGFRITWGGGESFHIEAWDHDSGKNIDLRLSGGFDSQVLRAALNMVFGAR